MGKMLDDITVLDLSSYITGPCATWMLQRMGARVIKLESPTGDMLRHNTTKYSNTSYVFVLYNRGKKSIAMDIRTEAGVNFVKKMVCKVDVVVENFVPGTLEKWGLSYEVLSAINPRLIFASIVGFGRDSKYSKDRAFDMVIQAMSGTMSSTGFPNNPPTVCGASYMDAMGPPFLVAGILGALYSRQKTGKGERIEVAMRDVAALAPTNLYNVYFESKRLPLQSGNRMVGRAPLDTYHSKDGYVYITATNNKHAGKLFKAMGQPGLINEDRFSTPSKRWRSREELGSIIESWTSVRTRDEAYAELRVGGVPCGPVLNIEEALNDSDLNERGVFQEIDQPGMGRVKVFSSPIRVGEESVVCLDSAPALGEHTQELMKEFDGDG